MKKIVWTFGLIAGAVMAGMFFLVGLPFHEQIGFENGMVFGYASMVAAFTTVYFGIRQYRDNIGGGTVSFGRAMAIGSLIVAISSSLYVASWEVYFFATNGGQEYMDGYQQYQLAKEKAKGATQADLDKIVTDGKKFAELYKNPVINSAITLLEPLPPGLLIALISAGVLSREETRDGVTDAKAAWGP